MTRKVLVAMALTAFALAAIPDADAAERVRGHYRSNGTYVQPYYRSNGDGNFHNNWSTKPNVNPYTGRQGTRITPPRHNDYRPYSGAPAGSVAPRIAAPRNTTSGSATSGGWWSWLWNW